MKLLRRSHCTPTRIQSRLFEADRLCTFPEGLVAELGQFVEVMHDITARIWAEAQKTREEIISGLRDFIAAGEGGEDGIQDLFCRKAEALGCDITSSSYHPTDVVLVEEFAGSAAIDPQERISVVAHAKAGGKGRSLILFAHPDCEKFVDDQGWAHDPFKGEIIDGKLYGWGVADDLSGIAAGLQAIALLHTLHIRPAADVFVASTPSKRHARGVSHLLQNGLQADAAVYLHPAESGVGLQEIKGFTSGQIEFRIEIEGLAPPTTEPHQTAFAHKGINAIDRPTSFGRRSSGWTRNALPQYGIRRSTLKSAGPRI